MKLTIDIDGRGIAKYFEEADGALNFTKLAIDAVIEAFTEKIVWDDEVRDYIQSELSDGLYAKIREYKSNDAIKDIAREMVCEAMKPSETGDLIVTLETKQQISEQVKRSIGAFNYSLNDYIQTTLSAALKDMIKALKNQSKMCEFIDYDRLSAYVMENVFKEGEDGEQVD